jgi:saccharopine dehydrogenase-like NADP-dependent oxidoreductase
MHDCETFVRGTLRFTGFSAIISAFHDIGLTSDDPAGDHVKTLRDLLESRLSGPHQHNNSVGPRSLKVIE